MKKPQEINFREIRKTILTAIAADEYLYERLVFKGGNALDLVYKITERYSLDLDFSLESDFEDLQETESRLVIALKERFALIGFTVFDARFETLLAREADPRWGGYRLEFKLIASDKFASLAGDIEKIRFYSLPIGEGSQKKGFTLEISKFEFCGGKRKDELDEHTFYVYSLPMIAAEKLRAICQKMAGYRNLTQHEGRARDFYDIFKIVTAITLDLSTSENMDLVRSMFAAKDVPLSFLARIEEGRSFHERDWPSVEATLGRTEIKREFSFYFDFVMNEVKKLKPLWEE